MSIYNIIAVAMVGIITGVFNLLLFRAGYVEPMDFTAVADAEHRAFSEAASVIGTNIPQIPLENIVPNAKGIYTVAFAQPESVTRVFTFAFVGIEVITGVVSAVILKFINVEKNIGKEQAEIKARREAENGGENG